MGYIGTTDKPVVRPCPFACGILPCFLSNRVLMKGDSATESQPPLRSPQPLHPADSVVAPRGDQRAPSEISGAAMRGIAWAGTLAIAARFMSLTSQLCLGWLLTERDYAIYAAALPIASAAGAIRNGGMSHVLIRRGYAYNSLAWPALQSASVFNLISAAAMIIGGFAMLEDSDTHVWLLAVWSIAAAISAPPTLFQAKLQIDLRFGLQSRLMMISTVISYSLMIVLAAAGAGAFAFVIPLIVVQLAETLYYGKAAGGLPHYRPLRWRRFVDLAGEGRWVMLSLFATVGVATGDYFIIERFEKPWLGTYFFGFQLSVAFASLVSTGIGNIAMASLSRMNRDPQAFAHAFAGAVAMMWTVASPVALVLAVLTPSAVHLLWQGKWDDSAVTGSVMSLILPFTITLAICQSALGAAGKFSRSAALTGCYALGLMLTTAVACSLGEQMLVTFMVGGYHVLALALLLGNTSLSLQVPLRRTASAVLPPVALTALAALPLLLVPMLDLDLRHPLTGSLSACAVGVVWCAAAWLVLRPRLLNVWRHLSKALPIDGFRKKFQRPPAQ